ncbi:hypothetical protein CC78DRAFT_534687 [Lojkania enalia]|uniref:Uncharacterized protein n=1 Tax=Lojkania enalia TaxID=147567 RepID=A0A9P4K4W7_9PLEO|nr:hypothetical protein CC78DRAFT_534687 [Didymosphaeria enalia]
MGDDIARDRLLHIAIVMQAEIINSLQLAVKYDNAILNLQMLHEASVMNRKNSLVTLDEMKQRILITRPISRSLGGVPDDMGDPRGSIESVQTFRASHPASSACYIPPAVTIPASGDSKNTKTGLARYFYMKQNSSQLSPSSLHRSSSSSSLLLSSSSSGSLSFSPALDYLFQGNDDRAAIMRDIDEIISAYQGLHLDDDVWYDQNEGGVNRDTLAILNGGDSHKRDTAGLNQDAMHMMLKNSPSTPKGAHGNSEYPAYTHNIFGEAQTIPYHTAPNPLPQRRMLRTSGARWSASSSVYSDSSPPSLSSNDSGASSSSPTSPRSSLTPPTMPFALQRPRAPPPIPTLAAQQQPAASRASFAAPQSPRTPIKEEQGELKAGRTRVHLVPPQPSPPLPPAKSAHRASSLSASSPSSPSTTLTPHPIPRRTSYTTSIHTSSAQPPRHTILSGRPCKSNNYWGFCKGSWAIREDIRKGLTIQTIPSGMFNSTQVWGCRHCHFSGPTVIAPVPGKKKMELVIDPRVRESAVGVRYKWIFLAKCHVKHKLGTNLSPSSSDGANFACLICAAEGMASAVYGNVETLMSHVSLEHGGMSEGVKGVCRAVVGRLAGGDEEWDVNIPTVDGL